MAPAFAGPDIVAIVNAYPPPLPSPRNPYAVRSICGTRLWDSRKVLSNFSELLNDESREERIPISELGSLLGVKDYDWILECTEEPLVYSRDRKRLLPGQVVELIWQDFTNASESRFVDAAAFSVKHDISVKSLDFVIRYVAGDGEDGTVETLALNGRTYWYSPELREVVLKEVKEALDETGSERIDLTNILHEIEPEILCWMAKGQIEEGAVEGKVFIEDGHAIFYPSSYNAVADSEGEDAQTRRVDDALAMLEQDGCVVLQSARIGDSTVTSILDQHVRHRGNEPPEIAEFDDQTILIMKPAVLENAIADFKTKAKTHVARLWCDGREVNPVSVLDDPVLLGKMGEDSISRALLASNYRKKLQAAVATIFSELISASRRSGTIALHQHIVGPAQLYTNGVDAVEDPALKERLDSHVTEILRTDILPAGMQWINASKLFIRDKGAAKEFEKFAVAISACRSCADINTAVAKYSRKQKLEPPSADVLHKIKTRIVQQKLNAMVKMKRGSDLLQNTIWVLLSQVMEKQKGTEALFVSSGKDVSRMVKLYQSLGDEGIGKQLEQWRDRLKAGQESKEDLDASRELARGAVEEMSKGGDGESSTS